ncbi:nuclear transport factor 2 family protein [Streptomyces sp. Go-475]|uniref:nuclear transport factor 2 family protein n=1 Tax=Streptomyces sp. Go-475 TaxID=2072505 RepID=UPI000DEECE3B|nr:nuclear transport factor 2 family protein [Streptomyces sp. Go-475]AXE86067.1 SnoaL-like domain protein [Streptomyces sp. Go-475]
MAQATETVRTAGSTNPTETVIDRYIRIFDRTAHEPAAVEELQPLFAPDATVQLDQGLEPVTGLPAIMDFYRNFPSLMADSQRFWTSTVLDDGRIECHWVQAGRGTDGSLVTLAGIEHATVNADGQITDLRNRMVDPTGWA